MTKKITIRTTDGQAIETTSGVEVDLDTHPLTLPSGRVLDEAGAQDLAADLLEAAGRPLPERLKRTGRPSLSGGSKTSPHVSFRVPETLRTRAEAEATRRGVSVSQLARQALEEHLQSR